MLFHNDIEKLYIFPGIKPYQEYWDCHLERNRWLPIIGEQIYLEI